MLLEFEPPGSVAKTFNRDRELTSVAVPRVNWSLLIYGWLAKLNDQHFRSDIWKSLYFPVAATFAFVVPLMDSF